MLGGLVVFVPFHIVSHLLGCDLAVVGGQGDDLVAGGLNGAGLVAVDVAADGGQHTLPGAENGGDDSGVGLGAAHQEVDIRLGGLTGQLYLLAGGFAVLILAVAHGLYHIRLHEPGHDSGVRALQVITVEIDHHTAPFLMWWNETGRSAVLYSRRHYHSNTGRAESKGKLLQIHYSLPMQLAINEKTCYNT